MNLFTKQKQTLRIRRQTYACQRERMGGDGIVRESGIGMYALLCFKQMTNSTLLYSRELCSMSCCGLDGRGVWGRMDTCI